MYNVRIHSTTAVAIVALVLAGTVVYQFVTVASLQSKITALEASASSVNQSCRQFYTKLGENLSGAYVHVSNVTLTLLARIQADNATIAMLNSTKPPGYQSVIATLNSDINKDQSAVRMLQDTFATREGIFFHPPNICG